MGGTKSAIGRFDAETWQLLRYERFPTRAGRGFKAVCDGIIATVRDWSDQSTVAVGVGVPGLVRSEDGVLLNAPNIPGSQNVPLRAVLQEGIGLPVAVENDAACFTLAEANLGAGRGLPVVLGVTVGTGVGGGIAVNGRLFQGSVGLAAEFGHMLLTPGSVPYESTDARGTVEQRLSGTALKKRCPLADNPDDYLSGDACASLRPDIIRELAWFCVNLTCVLNPSIIVFGGSAGSALGPHLLAIESEMRQWSLPGMPLPTLALRELEHPGTTGAALLTALE